MAFVLVQAGKVTVEFAFEAAAASAAAFAAAAAAEFVAAIAVAALAAAYSGSVFRSFAPQI